MKNKMHPPRLFTTFLFLLVSTWTLPIYAQTWLKEGQTWQYEIFGGWNFNDWGLHTMKVEGDTLIQGELCKKVVHYPLDSDPRVRFVYEKDGKVFVYESFFDSLGIMIYDFNMEIGDTLGLSWDSKYKVFNKGMMMVGGANRQFQLIKFFGNNWAGNTLLIVEGIGLVGEPTQTDTHTCSYFFLEDLYCNSSIDGWDIFFRCFQDGDFSYTPFNDCTLSGASSPMGEPSKLDISPNPANQSIMVKINGQLGYARMELLNTTGQIMRRQPMIDITNPLEVPVSDLPNGLYFVRLTNGQGSISKPVVVNH